MHLRREKKVKLLTHTLGIFVGMFFVLLLTPAFAQQPSQPVNTGGSTGGAGPTIISLEVPIAGKATVGDLDDYIAELYRFALSFIGIVAVIMIMWGGFKWVTAAGNSGKISDAKDTIYNAIIGLVLALLSWTMLNVINPALTKNTFPTVQPITPKYATFSDYIGASCDAATIEESIKICKDLSLKATENKDPNALKCSRDRQTSSDPYNHCTVPQCASVIDQCYLDYYASGPYAYRLCLCDLYKASESECKQDSKKCKFGCQWIAQPQNADEFAHPCFPN